ncbi:MAG: CDP-2,3-bis-(O-geranylgeranyl)-sn-glycerol synthase [Candidatus Aenigmatarchaeota archaeon]
MEIAWWWKDFAFAWWILFPAYAANMFPTLARGRWPIDFGRNFSDGRRLFGDGKTWEGLGFGVLMGTLIGALEIALAPGLNAYAAQFGLALPEMNLFVAFMIALGALTGDLAGSFLKRRMGMERGADAPLLDQLNFIVGATAFAYLFTSITPGMILFMLVVTPVIHRGACIAGYKLGVKKVPW